ncbi:hypothetical protein V6N12_032236 [Hibiscus sabdariffa]|uniref:Uncharacterized protein n=1 Tax=Hibiscus sabdariffa TaxID=183260 RepID=A0ABR2CC09_9ROSI
MGRAHLDALGETITLWAKLIDTLRETITLWVEKQLITLVEIIDSFFRNIRDSRGVKWKETTWHARTVATPKGGCLLICVHQHIHSSMEIKALVWEVPILRELDVGADISTSSSGGSTPMSARSVYEV